MPIEQMLAFAAAVTPIMLTPGVSAALVAQRVAREGRTAGLRVAAGTSCGLLVHAAAAALGLAAIVSQSATAFSILRMAGAAYLVVLGMTALKSAVDSGRRPHFEQPRMRRSAFVQALVANVMNPRAASIYLSLVPQFISPGDDVLLVTAALVGTHIAMQTAWLLVLTLAVSQASNVLTSWPARRAVEAAAGSVLIGLGLRTAAEGRPG